MTSRNSTPARAATLSQKKSRSSKDLLPAAVLKRASGFGPFNEHETRLEMSARYVQRMYRVRKALYSLFGPSLFVDNTGKPMSGRIVFLKHTDRPVPWINVSVKTAPARLAVFMKQHWRCHAGCFPPPLCLT